MDSNRSLFVPLCSPLLDRYIDHVDFAFKIMLDDLFALHLIVDHIFLVQPIHSLHTEHAIL